MRLPVLLAALLTLLPLLAPQAATVNGLYEAEVRVAGDDEQSRGDGELRALESVLVKLSGSRNVDVLSALALHDGPLRDLVQQYQLRGGRGDEPRRLWVRFDDRQLDALLSRSGIPTWGRTRPLTAVFLAVNDGARPRILAAGDNSGLAATVNSAAASRGIPVVLPLMDLRDDRQLRAEDLLAGRDQGVADLGQRYRGEATAFGTLVATSNGWAADWTLEVAGEARSWSKRGAPNALLELIVDTVADELAARFMLPLTRSTATQPVSPAVADPAQRVTPDPTAPAPLGSAAAAAGSLSTPAAAVAPVARYVGAAPASLEGVLDDGGIAMQVVGIRNVAQYGTVLSYLRSLDFVDQVQVTGVLGDTLSLSLQARGGERLLRQTIDIGHTLMSVSAGGLTYQLR